MNCSFCEDPTIKNREIIKNEYAWAFPMNIPIVSGHFLICPIRCIRTVDELTENELLVMFDLLKKLKQVLKKNFKAMDFNYAWNEDSIAGQTVPHLHFYILPRKEGDTGIKEYEPRKFIYRPGNRETSSEEELKTVTELLRKDL